MASYAILGPGGVGGLLAGALYRAELDPIVIAQAETKQLIDSHGLRITSKLLGDFTANPRVVERLTEPVDYLILTPKATALASALERVEAEVKMVVPLLNGLDHLELLQRRFGDRVVAGTVRVESDRPRPAEIVQTSPSLRIEVCGERQSQQSALQLLVDQLLVAGLPAGIGSSPAQVMWSKLVRLNALALTTSASGERIGFVREDPYWRQQLIGCFQEAAAVARADGADIVAEQALAELTAAHPELGSSMQRDIAAGRLPELDAIAGSVLRAAKRHGIECPTITALALHVAQRAGCDPPQL